MRRGWFVLAVGVVVTVVLLGDATGSGQGARSGSAGGYGIVYGSDWPGQKQAFVAAPSPAAAIRQVTFVASGALDPVPSPDGRRVAYRRLVSAKEEGVSVEELWVVGVDGRSPRRLSRRVVQVVLERIEEIVWSPNSTRIAYSTRADELFVASADGSANLLVGTIGASCRPVWSADSRRVTRDCFPGLSPNRRWIAGVDTSRRLTVVVTNNRSGVQRVIPASEFAWSPDSRWLAYAKRGAGIRVLEPETGRTRRLTRDEASGLAWSPDGQEIAYLNGSFDDPDPIDLRAVSLSGRVRSCRRRRAAVRGSDHLVRVDTRAARCSLPLARPCRWDLHRRGSQPPHWRRSPGRLPQL